MRRYAIHSVYNMRDLGGYPTSDGFVTQYGRCFRSDCPSAFDADDFEQIKALNIVKVIDLRTQPERLQRPSFYETYPELSYHNVTFKTGNVTPETEEGIAEDYLKMFEDVDAITSILKLIAGADGNVLYHCAVGKDRTGVVSALLLLICGVPVEDIIADYQVSSTYLDALIQEVKAQHPKAPEWFGASKPSYMQDCLRMLFKKYNTLDVYLSSLNLDSDIYTRIRLKLLTL